MADEPFAYRALMPHLVRRILVVASDYDSFVLEEEGRFSDRLLGQYQELDLSAPPTFHNVPSAREALRRLRREDFDLVLTTRHIRDMSPRKLAAEVAARHPGLPVVLLTYDRAEAEHGGDGEEDGHGVDHVFLWTGDPRLLLAVVKCIEDRKNVDHDTRQGQVRVILVVEDSPAFYSSFLPVLYSELLAQVRLLLADRLNERDRQHRLQARPKILLATSFEEARAVFSRFRKNLLGVISDVRFPRAGRLADGAGFELVRGFRRALPGLPVLLQSRQTEHAAVAAELAVDFADKSSPELGAELREFLRSRLGFGPFLFQLDDGTEVGRADTVRELLDVLRQVPGDSLRYHGSRNHVSNWLMARGEFPLALEVRPMKVSDFADTEALRDYLVQRLEEFLERRQRGQVTDFAGRPDPLQRDFLRLGRGSMGGKARSIAFMSRTKASHPIHDRYPGVRIIVPRTAVLCTEIFDRYCERGELRERALAAEDDEEVARLFLEQPLDLEVLSDLASILSEVRYPLAVRSSSLLEDSEYQPLAGLYRTYLLPNSSESQEVRLQQLADAVRLVFASTFFRGPRASLEAAGVRLEEEKMAVVVQRLVGRRYGERFYPHFAGVAQSRNDYPVADLTPEEGLAVVALGLGHAVVSRGQGLRFSPRRPGSLYQMSTPQDALRSSQRHFWALDLSRPELELASGESANLVRLGLDAAEADGSLEPVGATYSAEADRIYDTVHRRGARVVNFAGVLQHGRFPLAELLVDLLELTEEGMGTPVEMEFAVTLAPDGGREGGERDEMAILQLRPLLGGGNQEVDLDGVGDAPRLIEGPALGNGVIEDLRDVVYIHPERFPRRQTPKLARAVARFNERLARRRRPYVLIGPGRWGTSDRFLGVPVSWGDVSAARVMVEVGSTTSPIELSHGTHFFHNIAAQRVAYFCLAPGQPGERVDLDWLESQAPADEIDGVRHVELPAPATAWIDGRAGRGVVVRG